MQAYYRAVVVVVVVSTIVNPPIIYAPRHRKIDHSADAHAAWKIHSVAADLKQAMTHNTLGHDDFSWTIGRYSHIHHVKRLGKGGFAEVHMVWSRKRCLDRRCMMQPITKYKQT